MFITMQEPQLYFKSLDAENCYTLEQHLQEAKHEGLKKITLIKAELDNSTEHIWCAYFGEVTDIWDCKKSSCNKYDSKSGRGACRHKGKLYCYGEEIEFEVT